jgi:hypothetical protein
VKKTPPKAEMPPKAKLPKWTDYDGVSGAYEGVARLVDDVFADWERPAADDDAGHIYPDFPERQKQFREVLARYVPDREQVAIDAAKAERPNAKKNYEPLARLLLEGWHLSREALDLIVGRLTPAKRGRPKESEDKRRARTPSHDAADEMEIIKVVLKRFYPDQKNIRDRAISIAAIRAGIDEDVLFNYLRSENRLSRPRRSRRVP